jgi:hypothetical protein
VSERARKQGESEGLRRVVPIDFSGVDFTDAEVRRRLGRVYALLYEYRRIQDKTSVFRKITK